MTTSTTKTQSQEQQKKSKLVLIMLILGISLILVFMLVPGLKRHAIKVGKDIKSLGPFGPFLLIPISGLIVIPFGLPFMIFEMTNAFITDYFCVAVLISMISKYIGGTCCFFLGKYRFKKRILDSLKGNKLYQGIDALIDQKPLKISCAIRLTNLPLFIKSYGLLLSEKVTYCVYTFANMSTGIIQSIVEINIFRQAKDIHHLLNHAPSSQKIYSFLSLGFSALVFVAIILYTRRMIKLLRKESQVSKGGEVVQECSNKDEENQTKNQEVKIELKSDTKMECEANPSTSSDQQTSDTISIIPLSKNSTTIEILSMKKDSISSDILSSRASLKSSDSDENQQLEVIGGNKIVVIEEECFEP